MTHATVVTDARAGWTCDAGASLVASAMTPGPGRVGTLHAVIYVCPTHQSNADKRIAEMGWTPEVEPAPSGHRADPWPCGHITAYQADATAGRIANPDLVDLNTGTVFEWVEGQGTGNSTGEVAEGYANSDDHDWVWSRQALEEEPSLRIVEWNSLDDAERQRLSALPE